MKWYTSSSSVARRVESETKGEERAKELWTSLIRSELLRASPRRSAGNAEVKSLNSIKLGPMSTLSSGVVLLRRTERRAWVPAEQRARGLAVA